MNFRTFPHFRISHAALASVQPVNITPEGKLPSYAWPGGYPLYYQTDQGTILCPGHASVESDFNDEVITSVDVNWEDASLYCEHGERIESAYAEDEADQGDEPVVTEDIRTNPYI